MIAIDVERITDVVGSGQMRKVDIGFQRRHISSPLSPAESRGLLHGESTFAVWVVGVRRVFKSGME
jgi:hypothetical protein